MKTDLSQTIRTAKTFTVGYDHFLSKRTGGVRAVSPGDRITKPTWAPALAWASATGSKAAAGHAARCAAASSSSQQPRGLFQANAAQLSLAAFLTDTGSWSYEPHRMPPVGSAEDLRRSGGCLTLMAASLARMA